MKTNLTAHLLEDIRRWVVKFEGTKVRIGVIGPSGAGKSTIINALLGENVAATGVVETTLGATDYSTSGLAGVTLTDLPGCGTERFPTDTYIRDQRLPQDFDAFILVTSRRVFKSDTYLYEELARKAGKPFFVVRTWFDSDIENETRKARRGLLGRFIGRSNDVERRLRMEVGTHLKESLRMRASEEPFFVCGHEPARFDMPKLVDAIARSLPEAKRQKFEMGLSAHTNDIIDRKRKFAKTIVKQYSALAALNGVNPVPGLDVGVDLTALVSMQRAIYETFGLGEEQLAGIASSARSQVVKLVAQGLAEQVGAQLTKEAAISLIKKYAGRQAAKSAIKWLPVLGQIASAAMGYGMCWWAGEETIERCEAGMRELLKTVAQGNPDEAA
jgi:GTPase SAR1 family protein/uncharacterized protein (DUF697 family)